MKEVLCKPRKSRVFAQIKEFRANSLMSHVFKTGLWQAEKLPFLYTSYIGLCCSEVHEKSNCQLSQNAVMLHFHCQARQLSHFAKNGVKGQARLHTCWTLLSLKSRLCVSFERSWLNSQSLSLSAKAAERNKRSKLCSRTSKASWIFHVSYVEKNQPKSTDRILHHIFFPLSKVSPCLECSTPCRL